MESINSKNTNTIECVNSIVFFHKKESEEQGCKEELFNRVIGIIWKEGFLIVLHQHSFKHIKEKNKETITSSFFDDRAGIFMSKRRL